MSTSPSVQRPSQFRINKLPWDDDTLWWTVFGLFGYRIPRVAVCPGHVAPFTAFADAYFARSPSAVWKASRGLGGKSRTLAVLGLTEAVLLSIEVTILGGSFAQSKNVHDATKEAWDWHAAPRHLMVRSNQYDTILHKNPGAMKGGHLRTLTASQTSVRGPHPPRLRMDEIDEMDQNILDAALGQPMEQVGTNGFVIPTQTVMCLRGDMLVLTKRGEVPIKDVTRRDYVMTRQGWRKVKNSILSGQKKTVGLQLSNGRTLWCTDDHRIAVPGGWMLPKDMSQNQEVFGINPDLAISHAGLDDTPDLGLIAPVLLTTPDAGAGTALPALPIRTGVLVGVGVSSGAVGLDGVGGAGGSATQDVDLPSDGFEMGDVDARSTTASPGVDVIEGQTVRDGADQADVRPDVNRASVVETVHVPVATRLGPVPDPASVGVDGAVRTEPIFVVDLVLSHDDTLQYVYDVEVEDVHEFVAEGIVVHNSSTHQYPDKTMSEMIGRAIKAGHPVFEWCYKETSNPTDGWLTPQAIKRARSVVSQYMWETEYDLQEPSFAGRAIDSDAVDRAFVEDWGTFSGDEATVFAPYVKGRHYLTAVDWAKQRDQTIVATFDTTEHPWQCVAWQKVAKLPWPLLVQKAVEQWREYGDRFVHDRTGIGEFAHDEVKAQVSSGEFAKVTGVVMGGGRTRDALYNDYIAAIEHDDIRYPRIQYAYSEHKYVTPDALFTSKEHAPDSVVAGALAWSMRKRSVSIAAPGGSIRASSPWGV